jgi:hypothetical protein
MKYQVTINTNLLIFFCSIAGAYILLRGLAGTIEFEVKMKNSLDGALDQTLSFIVNHYIV